MRRPHTRPFALLGLLTLTLLTGSHWLMNAAAEDRPVDTGPDVVILNALEEAYDAVPFDHKTHASMAQMWNGCETCHHRSPQPDTAPGGELPAHGGKKVQADSTKIPACKSCHSVSAVDADLRTPSLKGAYHRQCLNCHQEWMHENACASCHKAKKAGAAELLAPTPDDIIGRMHPPIPAPKDKFFRARFTPPAGGNVIFRHKEHTADFGIRCVNCHHRDNCSDCHDPEGTTIASKPLRQGLTWKESHGPCISCHQTDRCAHCHFQDDQAPPQPFNHAATSQPLDPTHALLACGECHVNLESIQTVTCGDAACHPREDIKYPAQRPGPMGSVIAKFVLKPLRKDGAPKTDITRVPQ